MQNLTKNSNQIGSSSINKGIVFTVFIVVFLVSLLVNTPASWLLKNAVVQQAIAQQGLSLKNPQGTIWNGQTELFLQQKNEQPLGRTSWQLNPWQLFLLKVDVDVQWLYKTSKLTGNLTTSAMSLDRINFREIAGKLSLPEVLELAKGRLPNTMQMLQSAQGQIEIVSLNGEFDTSTNSPVEIQGQAQVVNFELLQNQLPTIEVEAQQLVQEPLRVSLLGEAKKWNLQGEFTSQDWFRYRGELNVKATSANDLPEWVYTLQKRTPTHYFLRL